MVNKFPAATAFADGLISDTLADDLAMYVVGGQSGNSLYTRKASIRVHNKCKRKLEQALEVVSPVVSDFEMPNVSVVILNDRNFPLDCGSRFD